MPTITSGTCTATNGLSLDASTKCVCTTITCNTGNYINLTALTCNTRSITCISGDDTSYHASLDKCTKCNYTDNYLNRDAN